MKNPVVEKLPSRNFLYEGDSLKWLRLFPDNCVTAVVTDPPYGLSKKPDMREVLKHWLAGEDYTHSSSGFMGKGWDSFVPGPKVWEEIYRVLKPGGHVLSFSGTRTYDLMLTAMRLAEFEVRDKIDVHMSQSGYQSWVYGSGFPKSLNIGKAMDNEDNAKKWEGYGTALKPAHEPIADFVKGDAEPLESDSRFKYQAKSSKKERNSGCKEMCWNVVNGEIVQIDTDKYFALENENEERKGEDGYIPHRIMQGNVHPTVKPLDLCRYLVRLVKMPGDNLILDPFCGSGSVLCAAILEGCDYVGIDMDPMSIAISDARTHYFRCLGKGGLK